METKPKLTPGMWPLEYHHRALKEGWILTNDSTDTRYHIAKVDDPPAWNEDGKPPLVDYTEPKFTCDEDALAFVRARAKDEDLVAMAAVALHGQPIEYGRPMTRADAMLIVCCSAFNEMANRRLEHLTELNVKGAYGRPMKQTYDLASWIGERIRKRYDKNPHELYAIAVERLKRRKET